ncbi:MAG: CDP-alcohol phosphatidyltransferase family protein [Deltaproteobacteria bacterium]|nr:CDP-alcohol phosphatidyltransferase family protein [Deltaproteobacteria bacterium]MCW5803542.1 CDP-alcohol phosphatidyltransferase family protein [Deltaproteobacteria bacterium]
MAKVVSPFNPANAVTASRFLTLPPFVWAVDHGYHQWATLFILICGLLDKVDGFVAKIFDCRSAFGEVFDAITDGLCYGFALSVVAAYGWAPVAPVVLIILMGLANAWMRLVYGRRAGRTVNYKSYAMERIVAYTGYLVGFATAGYEVAFYYWAFVPLQGVIMLHDAKRMLLDAVPARGEAAR